MFTEIFTEARPDLVVNTVPNYILIVVDDEFAKIPTDYYLVPLSDITSDELSLLEYESYFDSSYVSDLANLLCRLEQYKTDALVIKANIVAVYRK